MLEVDKDVLDSDLLCFFVVLRNVLWRLLQPQGFEIRLIHADGFRLHFIDRSVH
jgi:hypothetical protein